MPVTKASYTDMLFHSGVLLDPIFDAKSGQLPTNSGYVLNSNDAQELRVVRLAYLAKQQREDLALSQLTSSASHCWKGVRAPSTPCIFCPGRELHPSLGPAVALIPPRLKPPFIPPSSSMASWEELRFNLQR